MIKRFLMIALVGIIAIFSTDFAMAQPEAKKTAKPPVKTPANKAAKHAVTTISKEPYLGAIIVDAATGKVLFEDHADARGIPASVLKLMDLLIVLEKVENHQLTMTDPVSVSARAAKMGGSQVYLEEKEVFSVDEMLYALMIQSANDAAVALAEKVGGSCESFVQMMNQRAKQLGMNNTVFHSVHGLPPGSGQEYDMTTARDLSILCRELLKHPDTLRYTSTRSRPFRPPGTRGALIMNNHDHLLGQVTGCDGFKTGYIRMAGYSIAITAAHNGRRVIVIVLDSPTRKGRDARATELVAKGFALLPPEASIPSPAVRPIQPAPPVKR